MQTSSHDRTRPGFSLLELALVIALLAVISIMAIGVSTSSIERNRLRSMETVVMQGIRRAHTRSIHNVGTTTWGVYLCMPTSDAACAAVHNTMPSVIIFTGSDLLSAIAANNIFQTIETSPDTVFSGDLYDDSINGNKGIVFKQLDGDACHGACTGTNALSGSIIIRTQNNRAVIRLSEKGIVERM